MWMLHEEVGHDTRWIPMFRCTYGFLHEQVSKQLPDLHANGWVTAAERLAIYRWLTFDVVDILPNIVFFFELIGTNRTVIVPHDLRTKTVSKVSLVNVLAGDRTFAF